MALVRTSEYGKLIAELKRIWKEAVKTQSKYYLETGLERRRKILEDSSQYIRCDGRYSDRTSPEHASELCEHCATFCSRVVVPNYYHVPQDIMAKTR
jgi:hypothetical protein